MSKRNAKFVHLFALIALVANLFAPVFTQPVLAEDLVPSEPVVTSSTESDEAEAQRQAEEEAERKRIEEETRQKAEAEADAAATRAAEDAAATKAAEDAAATKAAEDAAATRAAEEEAARQQAEADAAATKAAEDAAATKAAEDAAATKAAEEEAAATKAAEDAAATKAAEGKSSDVVAPNNGNSEKPQQKVNAPAISLVPQDPQVQGCGDDLSVTSANGPAGITYSVHANGDGSYTVAAAIDPSMHGSHTLNVEGTQWKLDGEVAHYHVDPVPCPEMKTLGGPNHEVENITICHATGNEGHYTSNTVSWQAITKKNGHWYHQDGNDIIPEFVDGNGKTWGPRPEKAQEIIDNGCKVPTVKPVLAISKIADPPLVTIPANGSTTISFTVTVINTGDADATGVSVKDTVPMGAEGWSLPTGCVQNGLVITCSEITVPASDSINLTFSLDVPWSWNACGTFENNVKLIAQGAEIEKDRAEASVTINCEFQLPDFEIAHEGCVDGSSADYIVTISNLSHVSPDIVNGEGVSYGYSDSGSGNTAIYAIPSDATGDHYIALSIISENYQAPNPPHEGWVQVGNLYQTASPLSLEAVDCEPELTIEKTVVDPPVYANGISWKITVKNHGDTGQSFRVVETSPDGTVYWELLDAGKYACVANGWSSNDGTRWTCDDYIFGKHSDGTPREKVFYFSSEMAKECGTYHNTVTLQVKDGYDWKDVGSAFSVFEKDCPEPELSIEKTLSKPKNGSTVSPGEKIGFTVTVKNQGSARAEGVTFTDTLPAEFVGQGWSWSLDGCELNGNVITCGPFNLGKNKSKSFTFTATVPNDGSVCGEFTNTATLGGENGGVSTLGYNPQPKTSYSASVTIECEPGVKIKKTASETMVEVGDSFTYTIKVTNIGDTTLSGYVVTDELDTDYLSFESSLDGLCSESPPGSGLVTCDVAELTPDGQDGQTSQTFTITVQVVEDLDPEMCGTWIKNSAHVGKPDIQLTSGGNNQSGAVEDTSNTVQTKLKDCDPKVEIEKVRTSAETADPGDTITFEVTVKNTGSGVAKDVSFTDTMDAELASLDWTVDEACEEQGDGSWSCGPFDLNASAARDFEFSATVPVDGTVCSDEWLYNRVSIASEGDNGQPGFQTTSGGQKSDKPQTEDSAKVKINCDPGIKIEKDDQVDWVIPGQEFTYKITVTNTGNTELSGYVMTDTMPLDYLDFVGFGEGTTCDGPTASGEVTCDVATLSPSSGSGIDSQTFYITVKVKTALDPWMCDDQIKNVASVAVSESGDVQISSYSNDDVSDSTTEVTKFRKGACTPNIDITKTDNVGKGEAVEPGGSYTYTITVTNNGDIDANGYVMTDTIPDDLTFTTPDGCESNGQTITCDVPALEPGEDWTVEIEVTLTDNPSGYVCKYGVRNMAEVQLAIVPLGEVSLSGGYGGQPSTYDKDVEYTPVNCDPDIDITKDVDLRNAEPGDTIDYTITIENTGNLDLYDVVLADLLILLPVDDWSFDSPDGVLCAIAFENFGCVIDSMETGDVIEITLSGTITTAPVGLTCFTGFINGVGVGAKSSGGRVSAADSVYTKLDCDPSVEFTKTALEDTVEPGGTMAFEIVFTNTGNIDVTNATINDQLPELPGDAEWEVTTAGASESLVSFPYEVTNLEPGQSVKLVARAQVPAELELTENGNQWCKLRENTAKVKGKYSTRLYGGFNEKASADIQVNCTGVSIVKDAPATVDPGESLTYTVQVSNMGNTTVNMTVTDTLDERLSNIVATVTAPSGTIDCDIVNDSEVNCPISDLAEGEVATITITADVIATPTPEQCDELILNRASISPTMVVLRQSQSVTIPQEYPLHSTEVETSINCEPDLEIEKEGPAEAVQPGEDIVFTVTVRNVGTYPTTTSITDGLPTGLAGLTWNWSLSPDDSGANCEWIGGSIVCDDIALDGYGDELVITLTATTDVQNPVCGEYTNQAGISTGSRDQLVFADVMIDCEPDYEIEKTSSMTVDADENDALSAGDTITYTISVTNTGNQHLSGITLDDQFTGAGEGGLTWIAPEGFDGVNVPTVNVDSSIDLVATYVITQADVDTGEIENCALMTYQVDDESSLDRDDCIDDEIEQTPDYAVEKTSANTDDADENNTLSVGDTITYTITVTNTGNLTLNDIMLDDQFSGAGEGGLTWIAPEGFDGENVPTVNVDSSIDLVATYVITQADVDAGEIENCAFMTYQVDEETVIDRDDCVDNPLEQEPVFTVEKTSANTDDADDNGAISEGDTITYTITVTNTGNQTLNGITLDDQFTGAGEGGLTWIAPAGFDGVNVPTVNVDSSIDLVATYVITQVDVDAGEIENCALMTYQVDEENVIERDDCEEDEIPQNPSISMEKVGTATDNPDVLALGNIVTYTFTITNTGDVTLTDLEIEDPMVGVRFEDGNVIESLAPGESVQKRARYAVAQLDMDNGLIVNCADIIAMAPDGSEVTDDSCDTRLIDQDLSLAVGHECPGFDDGVLLAAGDAVEFEITISNPGNVSVHNVTVVATREGSFNEPFSSTFEPGQEETRTYTVIATEEEAETLEVHVGFTVTGDMQAGVNQLMASMAMMQSTGDRTTSSTDFDCGLGERPVPVVPDSPSKPATDSAVKAVSQLPNTGSGSVASAASVLWAAAMLSVFALGATAVGIRVKHRR